MTTGTPGSPTNSCTMLPFPPFARSLPRDIVLDEGDISFEPALIPRSHEHIYFRPGWDGTASPPRRSCSAPPRSLLPADAVGRSVGRSVSPELLMYFQSPTVVSYPTYSGAIAVRRVRAMDATSAPRSTHVSHLARSDRARWVGQSSPGSASGRASEPRESETRCTSRGNSSGTNWSRRRRKGPNTELAGIPPRGKK